MTNEEIGNKIHEAWNDFSYELFMDKSTFTCTDIAKAFSEGANTVLKMFGIIDDNNEYINK
jgi:hypothetical protein